MFEMQANHNGNHDWCLYARRLPGRVNAEEAARLVGCKQHDIAALIRLKLLKPLGGPRRNTVKYFATVRLLAACADEVWLGRMTVALTESRQKPIKDSSEQLGEAGRDSDT